MLRGDGTSLQNAYPTLVGEDSNSAARVRGRPVPSGYPLASSRDPISAESQRGATKARCQQSCNGRVSIKQSFVAGPWMGACP